jgi:hypothetical protein
MDMKVMTRLIAGAAAAVAAAVPASAQVYDDRYDRDRDVVDEVVDGVARVAGAVAQATRGGYYDPRYGYGQRYGYGYNQGGERYAADACAYEAQRRYARRYGGVGVDVRDVQWYRRDRLRVYGTLDLGDYGRDRYGYDPYRSSRYDPYRNRGYGNFDRRIGFTCTVRPDGRVTDFDTDRRYY